jgi:hypothetical protein
MHISDSRLKFTSGDLAIVKTVRFFLSLLPDRIQFGYKSDEEETAMNGWARYSMLTWAIAKILGLKIGVELSFDIPMKKIEEMTFCIITPDENRIVICLPYSQGGPILFHRGTPEHYPMFKDCYMTLSDFPEWFSQGIDDYIESISAREPKQDEQMIKRVHQRYLGEATQPI